jgi:TonB-dependent SusC/RagA subfamily outer membrane receptor
MQLPQPLQVVMHLHRITPADRIADLRAEGHIETLEILKGASAAAIYGAKTAAGVIIINTKRGRIG